MTNDAGSAYERALEIAVEARTLARQAHERADNVDAKLNAMAEALTQLQVAVGKLNTKVGLAATAGSLIGGGIIAAAVTLLGH